MILQDFRNSDILRKPDRLVKVKRVVRIRYSKYMIHLLMWIVEFSKLFDLFLVFEINLNEII